MSTHTNENDSAHPVVIPFTSDLEYSRGLTAREHAAIHLRVPMSGNPWLDEMIEAARKRDTFQALPAAFAGAGVPEEQIVDNATFNASTSAQIVEVFGDYAGAIGYEVVVDADFARRIERERNEARAEVARLQMELDASCNAEELRQAREENARLRESVKDARDCILRLLDNGHDDGCAWINYANAACTCGVEAGHAVLGKLQPFLAP